VDNPVFFIATFVFIAAYLVVDGSTAEDSDIKK